MKRGRVLRSAVVALSFYFLLPVGFARAGSGAIAQRQQDLERLLRQQRLNQLERENRATQRLYDLKNDQLRHGLNMARPPGDGVQRRHELDQLEQRLNQIDLERRNSQLRLEQELGRLEQQQRRDGLGDPQHLDQLGIQQRQDRVLQEQKWEQLRGELNQLRQRGRN